MKFLFYPQGCLPIHGKSLEERPLGGTEAGLIYLADELASLGHSVTVLSQFKNPPLTRALYLPYFALADLGPVDVLVAVREWAPLLLPIESKVRLFWSGDSYDQPQNVGLGDRRVSERIDAFLAVSDWHGRTISETSRFPLEKVWVIRNGIKTEYFSGAEPRHRKRLIYSSTPYRGLQLIPAIFPAIRAQHPDAELHVFSGYDVYAGPDRKFDAQAVNEFQTLRSVLEKLPGCFVHGNVSQRQLAREFMRSSVLCYPNTFAETSCITALEAQAAGCAIVSSNYGALPETVGESGILIDGTPGSAPYLSKFTAAVNRVLADDGLFDQLSIAGKNRAANTDWRTVAERLLQFIETKKPGLKQS